MQKICLILAAISLLSCNQIDQFPKVNKWVIDVDNNFCIKCELVDQEKLTFKCVDIKNADPLKKCNGYFAQSPEDFLAEKNWALDTIEKVKKNCGH